MTRTKEKPAPGMTAEQFANIIDASGMKIKAIAKRLGVSRQSIYVWKTGKWPIDKRTAEAIKSLIPAPGV